MHEYFSTIFYFISLHFSRQPQYSVQKGHKHPAVPPQHRCVDIYPAVPSEEFCRDGIGMQPHRWRFLNRHKYYDLRDYIKSYGVNNRISRPGDTFSLHREKLVFITVSGKHLKVCFALNPADYDGSTIPVTTNTSKKFETLPLGFKVKSDLSFRRAKKLVDDLMAAKGYTKEENE